MAIYLPTHSPEIPATAPAPPPVAAADIALPDSTENPLLAQAMGESPWDVEEAEFTASLQSWRQEAAAQVDKAALEPDAFFQGKDLSFARDPKQAQILATNDAFLSLQLDGDPLPPGEMQRALFRQETAQRLFGGAGAESEEAFHAQVVGAATKRRDSAALGRELTVAAYDDAMLPSDKAGGYTAFREKLKAMPGYDPEKEPDYMEAWHETRRMAADKVEEFREPLVQVWRAFKIDGNVTAAAFDAWEKLTPEQRPDFLDALAIRAAALPVEERKTFWQNLSKQTELAISDYGRNAAEGIIGNVYRGGRFGWEDVLGSNEALAARDAEDAKVEADFQSRRNFAADIRRIAREDYDPLKSAFGKEGGKPGFWEGVAYQAPAVTGISLTMAVPVVGMGTMYFAMEGEAYETLRGRMMAGGADDATATAYASGLAPFVAMPSAALEKAGFAIWARKLPGFSKALDRLGDQITNRALRFGGKALVIGTAETGIELTQEILNYTVQDIAAALSEDVPDVDWSKELAGTWANAPETFAIMLPLALLGAAGGLSRESQHAAFKRSTTTEKQALGMTAEGIAGIEAAQGPSALAAAIDNAWATREPDSPEAAAAVAQLQAQVATQRQAQAALEELGYGAPSFTVTKDGIFVFDNEGKELGIAKDTMGAIRIARAHTVALDNLEADQVAALGSMMEAAQAGVELDPNSQVEVNLGQFDLSQATPEMAARFAAQVALKEQAEGGTGDIARSVLGYSETSFAQGVRETVNRLFRGASVTDVFHETFHGLRRQARKAGTITREDEIAVLRALDTVLGGRKTKDGTQLRFIPEGMLDADISETLLDEALSEIAEMELLRTRKGQGKGKLGLTRGVISRNLTALAKLAPGAVQTFKSFIDAVRARWGLSLSRAVALKKAERDGKFDKDGYEAFLNKLLGLDAQAEHDAGVQSEFDRILGLPEELAGDDIPFSIGGMKAANWEKYQSQGRAFTGADGKPRFEMDASQAAFNPSSIKDPAHSNGFKRLGADSPIRWLVPEGQDTPLGNLISFDELFENYPQLAGLMVRLKTTDPDTRGSFTLVEINGKAAMEFSTITLSDRLNTGTALNVLLHEVQHAVQNVEGFARGSSPERIQRQYDTLLARYSGISSSLEMYQVNKSSEEIFNRFDQDEITADEMDQAIQELIAKTPAWQELKKVTEELQSLRAGGFSFNAHEAYRQVTGEKEARGVQARQSLTAEERAASPFMDSWGSFSIGPAQVADIMAGNALARITDPRRRTQVMSRIARDYNSMRLQIDRMASLAGIRRSKGDMRREAAAREELRAEELIGEVHSRFGELMADDDLVKIKAQPVHAHLADPDSPLRGRLKSKTQAIKQHPDMFQLHRAGDYDGSDGISRSVFGGQMMPDQAAQELYDHGLIPEPTPDALWEALAAEQNRVAGMKELLEKAKEQIREAKAQAKQEANEWLATQATDQEVNFSDKEEIRRSLRMLDAILLALPAEIRGKIGGYTQISMINSDAARLSYLKDKLAKADKELETYLRVEYAKEWEALLKKAAPATNAPGERPTGSIAADAYDIFREAEAAMGMKFSEGEAKADYWDAIADHADTEAHDADVARVKAQMIRLTMNWTAADAARREQAVLEGEKIYYQGLVALRVDASRRRERLNTLRDSAIAGTGKTGNRMQRKAAEIAAKGNRGREALQMAWEFLSFGQVVNVLFGENSGAARWFNARELAASNAFEDAFQAKADAIETLFTQLAGNRFHGEKLKYKMSTQDTITVTDALGQEHTFTDSAAITFLLMWRQEDGQRHMRGIIDEDTGAILSEWAWDDASAAAIEAQLSDAGKAAMAFLGQSYGEEYGRINDVFRRIWNVSMPRHKMYSPLSVAPAQGKSDTLMDPVSGETMGAGMTPGSLKNRSFSAIAEPLFKDAFQVYVSHARQMEHFIAYGEFARDALAIVNRREARNAIEANGGPFAAGVLSKWLDLFATGGVKDANMGGAIARTVGQALGGLSQAALVGRVSVLAMQSLQLVAAGYQMPISAFLLRLAKLKAGRLNWGAAIQSPYIQRRISLMPPIVRDAVQGLATGNPNRAKYLAAQLGRTISGADALFTGGTYAIFYDYHLKQAQATGLANPEAHAHAEAERLTDKVAQPERMGARSWVEVANQGNPAFRAMWNFSSDPRQKMALVVYEMMRRDKKGGEKAAAVGKALTLTWLGAGVLAALLRAVIRDLRDDEDDEWFDDKHWDPKRLGLMALTGPFAAMPYVGGVLEETTYNATGQFMPGGGLLSGIGDAFKIVPSWMDGDFDALKDIEKVFTAGAAASRTSGALASAMHILRDAWGIIENIEGPD